MLAFEYCECGCKGSESATIGSTTWWYYIDLAENLSVKKVHLHRGHGWTSPLIKECKSVDEAVQVATEEAREVFAKEYKHLLEIQRQLNAPPPKPPKLLSFEEELRLQFPGPDNRGMRVILRECRNSRQIILMSRSSSFSSETKKKLKLVAEAFHRSK